MRFDTIVWVTALSQTGIVLFERDDTKNPLVWMGVLARYYVLEDHKRFCIINCVEYT